MLAQLVVQFSLRRFQLAEDGLLEFLRQIAGDLRLGAAKNEWAKRTRQELSAFGVLLLSDQRAKHRSAAEHAGVEEFEEAPQLANVIFNRRAGQCEAMPPAQQTRRLGGL